MRTLDLTQGSSDWLAMRARYHTASEASVLMGASSKATRADLLRLKATGDEQKYSRWTREVLFARGHEIEAAARPFAEGILEEELYPVTAVDDGDELLASFDGITLLGDTVWECKQWNESKADAVREGKIPDEDYWQIVQQLAVSGAERCLYMVTDGTESRTVYTYATPIPKDEARLRAAWAQFDEDLAQYQPRNDASHAIGAAPSALPALHIEVTGAVQASNLREFRDHALAVFEGINTDLQTDEHFADAEQTVKWCKDVETRLDAAKDHALGQTASIDELFRSIDEIKEHSRRKRLELDKLVKARKEAIRGEILTEGRIAIDTHIAALNKSLGGNFIPVDADFAAVMKGKKTVKSLRDAVDQELARAKLSANEIAERIRGNLARFDELASEYPTLFPDRHLLVLKERQDMEATIKVRISDHEERERQRLEADRERIRQEEQRKAQQEVERKARQEAEHEARQVPDNQAKTTQAPVSTEAPSDDRAQPADDGARINLRDINTRIYPLSISAAGLFEIGFDSAGRDKSAKLYRASDFPAICERIIRRLREAQQAMKDAA